jgi:hypothetical protein
MFRRCEAIFATPEHLIQIYGFKTEAVLEQLNSDTPPSAFSVAAFIFHMIGQRGKKELM